MEFWSWNIHFTIVLRWTILAHFNISWDPSSLLSQRLSVISVNVCMGCTWLTDEHTVDTPLELNIRHLGSYWWWTFTRSYIWSLDCGQSCLSYSHSARYWICCSCQAVFLCTAHHSLDCCCSHLVLSSWNLISQFYYSPLLLLWNFKHNLMQTGKVIPMINDLLCASIFFLEILSSLEGVRSNLFVLILVLKWRSCYGTYCWDCLWQLVPDMDLKIASLTPTIVNVSWSH